MKYHCYSSSVAAVTFTLFVSNLLYMVQSFTIRRNVCVPGRIKHLESISQATFPQFVNNEEHVHDELKEAIKLFGRLSDKLLLLDVEGAGTPEMANCCHGGCDNCNYSHVFDSMSAGRPKWVAMYATRKLIDGRSHSSPWVSLFSDDTSTVSQEEFIVGLQKLPYRVNMGPPSLPEEVDSADLPSEAMLRKLWKKIARSDDEDLRISKDQLFASLKTLTGEEHGAMWASFQKIFLQDSRDS